MTAEEIRKKLLGAWSLVSWQSVADDGSVLYPLGENAVGQLMYDAAGRVSAQLVRPHQKRFDSEDWRKARPEEMVAAWPGYFGYFGTFTVDTGNETVTRTTSRPAGFRISLGPTRFATTDSMVMSWCSTRTLLGTTSASPGGGYRLQNRKYHRR
jgi:hypothetical protein